MLRRTFSFGAGAALALTAALAGAGASAQELRVLVHGSFSLPKPLLAQFEADAGVKLGIIKGGDAGEMLNKLILTRAQPIADVVFGIDNALVSKAVAANVLEPYAGPAATRAAVVPLPGPVVAVDYGYVNLNYDKAWFAKSGLALPKSLDDLALPAYRELLVVQNPATSSPGYAFLLATVSGLGEQAAFDWWARMRTNGVKVAKGWSEAYYTEFSRNGGSRPLVVSYASSPAAEVFYSKEKISEPPTGSLFLKGGVLRQVEGVALVRGGQQREAAGRFIEFMRSRPVQEALQTTMWMFAAEPGVARADVMRHAGEPAAFEDPASDVVARNGTDWVSRWTRVVLK
ncbi:thiamine ABC transporter substrate-binding protein [Comamonadaceae bacterium G21597-S1]|nr:thiamine ABC transporter substrate-binding protein [Comamonadaceae bacterium G21597-S1]